MSNSVEYRDDYASVSKASNPESDVEQKKEKVVEEAAVEAVEPLEASLENTAPEKTENFTEEIDSIEDRAKRMGWVPQDKYKGKPEFWSSAEDFVAKGENELPVVKENFRRLDKKYKTLEQDLAVMRESYTSFEKKAYEKALTEIKAQQKFAVEDGDVVKYDKLEQQKEELVKESVVEKKKQSETPQIPQEVNDWVDKNPWYHSDMELQSKAEEYSTRLERSRPDLSLEENLQEVERQIKVNFAHKFENPQRRQPSSVLSGDGARAASKSRVKTFSDLPDDAKKMCLMFERRKVTTRDKYIKDYFNQ